MEEEKGISSNYRLTLPNSGLSKVIEVTRILGSDVEHGLSRKVVTPTGEVFEPDGTGYRIYHLADVGFYETSQVDTSRNVARLYHRLTYSVDKWAWALDLVTPMELFKEIATDQAIFGWPAWFGRLFSPHLVAPIHLGGPVKVGDLCGLMLEGGELRLYLVIWVALFNEVTTMSEAYLCPIQVHEHETPATLSLIALDLRAKAIYPQELSRLPRGDWNSGGMTT